ncbi:DMT family transporter [Alicyclobacillus sp.]|uniref:EamA family transporter n=1 Tax=Alicyclobacillus sp. TaxID=61169 RepID=UPI0025BDCB58|nr:DMT family transporter [Alicyclobacillus sp.]MCL6517415.1 DMT family transporter [Alicyclobacillus sp.]
MNQPGGVGRASLWYAILVLLGGSCYGLVSPLIKLSLDHGFSVEDVTDGQYLAAVVILWAIRLLSWGTGRLRHRRDAFIGDTAFHAGADRRAMRPEPAERGWAGRPGSGPWRDPRQWLLMAVIGACGAVTSFAYYKALSVLPASLGIVLLFQFSWMVLVIDILVTRRLPSLEKWIGAAAIFIGTILAVGLIGQPMGTFPLWAFALGLLSALSYALTLYLSAFLREDTSPLTRSAITVSVSTVVIFCLIPPRLLVDGALAHGLWLWAVLVSLFGQTLPMLLMLKAIPHTGGRMAGVLGSIELPVAVLAAWLVLGEDVAWLRWMGVVLILAGIVVSEVQLRRRSEAPDPPRSPKVKDTGDRSASARRRMHRHAE